MNKIALSAAIWTPLHADRWSLEGSRLRVSAGDTEWTEATAQNATAFSQAMHVVIEASVSGKGSAAGFSFGAFQDFLASPHEDRSQLLQLEIDRSGAWRFRVDGVLQSDQWWNSAVSSAADLWRQPLMMKARWPESVYFYDIGLYRLAAKPRLSIVITCHRFAQRLRASLAAWCQQNADLGSYEVMVVNPGSADATHDVVAAAAATFPTARVVEIPADPKHQRNKGALINIACRAARGDWVLLTDADCLFDEETVTRILRSLEGLTPCICYGERRHLSKRTTQAILAGAIDPVRAFRDLAVRQDIDHIDRSPWGYTQLVPRDVLQSIPYHEGVDHYAHTDEIFVTECKRRGLTTHLLKDLVCLHLEHPFSWYGTEQFLSIFLPFSLGVGLAIDQSILQRISGG